jgi:hypothetical protein
MTQFKHIIVLVLLLLTFGFSAKAQGTPSNPYVGSTQTYTVSGISGGVSYEFYITASVGSARLDDNATGEFDFIGSTSGTLGVGDNAASAQIAWNNGASEHIYYVSLLVTASGGCSNTIHLEVVPQVNNFDLLSENLPVDHTISCPSVSESDGFNPLSSAYNAGTTTLHFIVKRRNGTLNTTSPAPGDTYNWSFIPLMEVDPVLLNHSNVIISIEGATSGVISAVDNRYTVSGFDNEVNVTVRIDNAPGSIREVMLQVNYGVESVTNLPDSNPSNNNVTHTIQVMPVIEGMGGV